MRESDQIRQACARKLKTVLFAEHYRAVFGCLLGERFVERQPLELKITADDEVSGPCDDGKSFSAWIGPADTLLHNVRTIVRVCELDDEETGYLMDRLIAIPREPQSSH